MCRSQADDSPRHRISRALGSMAGRWPYTRSPKWSVVTRSSGRGFVQRPPRVAGQAASRPRCSSRNQRRARARSDRASRERPSAAAGSCATHNYAGLVSAKYGCSATFPEIVLYDSAGVTRQESPGLAVPECVPSTFSSRQLNNRWSAVWSMRSRSQHAAPQITSTCRVGTLGVRGRRARMLGRVDRSCISTAAHSVGDGVRATRRRAGPALVHCCA